MGPRTLTARLTSGVVALVLAVVAISGIATYGAFKPFLNRQLEQQLNSVADSNGVVASNCLRSVQPSTSGSNECSPGGPSGQQFRSGQTSWIQILDSSGAGLLSGNPTEDLKILTLSSAQARQLIANPSRTITVQSGSDTLRVTARALQGRFSGFVAVSGLSESQELSTLHRLLLIELAIGGGAVLLALLATTVGVRLSLRPLHRVTATAREVTAELSPEGAGLDRRVQLDAADRETEVGQLAESVNTLLGAVETQFAARLENEQRMRQFLADASHELRTPLTSIRGYAELSRMRRSVGDEGDDNESMDRIESEGNRMSRLVEDLLTLARGDQGSSSERTLVDVGELLVDAVEGARAGYPGRPIEVIAPAGLHVLGDHDQLLRLVRNLVTNACVHTAPGGPVQVSGGRADDFFVIQVADSGPGLPPEQAAHVFERFWRADSSRARSSGGSGLGLAIVESIVSAHQGSIRFDSDVEAGSTVTIQLPSL